jgi:hypothetical protein
MTRTGSCKIPCEQEKIRGTDKLSRIKRLLHWWLGMKAINVILARDRLDRERKKKEENKRARLEMDSPQDTAASPFATLAPNAGTPMLNTSIAPAVHGEPPRHVQIYQVENLSRGSPISTSVYTPRDSESPVVTGRGSIGNSEGSQSTSAYPSQGPAPPAQGVIEGVWDRLAAAGMAGSRNGSISSQPSINTGSWPVVNPAVHPGERRRSSLATEIKRQPSPQPTTESPSSDMRQLSADIARLVSDLSRKSNSHSPNGHGALHAVAEDSVRGPYGGLDEDTLRSLRAYIYREEANVAWEENALLSRLETAWRNGVRLDDKIMLDNISVFIARERAFLTWIELKRHLADLDRADKRTCTQ